jgi:hypothetical protein
MRERKPLTYRKGSSIVTMTLSSSSNACKLQFLSQFTVGAENPIGVGHCRLSGVLIRHVRRGWSKLRSEREIFPAGQQ